MSIKFAPECDLVDTDYTVHILSGNHRGYVLKPVPKCLKTQFLEQPAIYIYGLHSFKKEKNGLK